MNPNTTLPTGMVRLRRYGTFAARMTALRLRRKLKRDKTPEYLSDEAVQFMGAMKGIPQKFGQHLSMRSEAYQNHFGACLAQSPPVADGPLLDLVAQTFGGDIFEEPLERIATASIAQVYRGRLRQGGDEVAIKVQYPGFGEVLAKDLAGIKRMVKLIGPWLPTTTQRDPEALTALIDSLGAQLLQELDFTLEAEAMTRFLSDPGAYPGVTCPTPLPELCTDKILTMSYVRGRPWHEALQLGTRAAQRDAVERMVRAYLQMGFGACALHADPHPGNLVASGAHSPLDELTLLDFGQVLRQPADWWLALYTVIQEARARRSSRLPDLFVTLGFEAAQISRVEDRLLPIARGLLRPFVTKGPLDLSAWRPGRELTKALKRSRGKAEVVGFPAAMVMLQRSFHGLFHVTKRFGLELDWFQLLQAETKGLPGY